MPGVRDIYSAGGSIPDPEGDKPPQVERRETDPLKDAEDYMARSIKRRTMEKELTGDSKPVPTTAMQLVPAPDYTPVLKAFADSIGAAITSVGSLYSKMTPQQAANSESGVFNKFLLDEFKDMRTKLNAPGPDLLSLLLETDERVAGLMERWKKREGVPQGIPVGLGNMDALIRIEELRGEREEKEHKWQEEMEERRTERAEANRRWDREFQLRLLELKDNRDSRHRGADMLDDLLGALGDGVAAGDREGNIAAGPEDVEAPSPRIPKAFRCNKCRNVIQVPTPDTTSLECPHCHTEYDLTQTGA